MLAIDISSSDVRDNLSDLLSRVGYGQLRVRVTRNGTPIAGLVPLEDLEVLLDMLETADASDLRAALEQLLAHATG